MANALVAVVFFVIALVLIAATTLRLITSDRIAILANIATIAAAIGGVAALVLPLFVSDTKSTSDTPPITVISSTATPSTLESGGDFRHNCISATNWIPYGENFGYGYTPTPSTPVPQKECWYLYDWGIDAQDGVLSLQKNASFGELGHYGISTPVSLNSIIDFDIDIERFGEDDKIEFGVMSSEQPKANFTKVLVVAWGGTSEKWFILREILGDNEQVLGINKLSLGKHKARFEIKKARMNVFIDDKKLNVLPVSVIYTNPHFWIGYSLSTIGGDVSTQISNFTIKQE